MANGSDLTPVHELTTPAELVAAVTSLVARSVARLNVPAERAPRWVSLLCLREAPDSESVAQVMGAAQRTGDLSAPAGAWKLHRLLRRPCHDGVTPLPRWGDTPATMG
jgi:hypothetical protein